MDLQEIKDRIQELDKQELELKQSIKRLNKTNRNMYIGSIVFLCGAILLFIQIALAFFE